MVLAKVTLDSQDGRAKSTYPHKTMSINISVAFIQHIPTCEILANSS